MDALADLRGEWSRVNRSDLDDQVKADRLAALEMDAAAVKALAPLGPELLAVTRPTVPNRKPAARPAEQPNPGCLYCDNPGRLYPCGWRCDDHSPAVVAARAREVTG
jgi:hypothetical protein